MKEIKWIHAQVKKHHPEKPEIMIMIFDEALTLSRKRIEILCNELIVHKFDPPLKLWLETRADHVDRELLSLIQRAGAKKINFGLESAVPHVLRRIGKVTANSSRSKTDVRAETRFLQKIQDAVRFSKDLGMFTSVSMIAGLPGETMEDVQETLRFVRMLDVDMYYHNVLNVLEGTQLEKEAGKLGYKWGDRPVGYMGKYGHRYTKAPIPTRLLPPLKNAMVYIRDKARFRFLLRGWGYTDKCTDEKRVLKYYHPFMLDVTLADVTGGSVTDLFQQMAGLSTTVLCLEKTRIDDPGFHRQFKLLPMKNGRFYTLPDAESFPGRIQGQEEADHSTPYFIPFKNYQKLEVPDDGRTVFLTITDSQDFDAFATLVMDCHYELHEGLVHSSQGLLPFDLYESCRWICGQDHACPAATLTHLHCGQDRGLSPCRYFPAMNGTLEEIRESTEKYIAKVQKKRGCSSCTAKDGCPRCTAPFPLSEEEYCDFMRSFFIRNF